MDFITSGFKMYRINAIFSPLRVEKYTAENVKVCIREVPITLKDSYETCAEKISNQKCSYDNNFVQELEKVTDLSWLFEYPSDSSIVNTNLKQNVDLYIRVLQNILHTLDPSIKKVEKIAQVEHTYVEKNSIIHDLYKAKVLESENEEDMSKKKMQSTAYKKCLVRWKIKDVLTGEVIETWKSKEMFRCYIAYYNMVIAKESKTGLCMLTGENVPLTELHAKNIFPLQSGAKLVSANDKTEYTFRGTFVKNAEDLLTIGYEASQKSHNMPRWLLNNFGIIAGNEMFVYWNPNGRYVPSPFEDRKEGEEIISDRETLYRSIFESTEDSLSSTDCIVIAAFKAMTTGRLALAYYSETPGNDFVAKLEKWKESFTGAKWIPSIYMVSKYAYGSERNERIEIESGIYTKKIEELLWCKLYGHPISESLKNALVTKASSPLKYKSLKNRRYITYIAALILRKYENDKAGKEVYTMTLDLDNTEINYLMGRLLAVYEKAELDTYTKEELKSRIPNAVRYQNKYVQRPAATLIVLKNKIVPYLNKLKRKKNGLYIKYQKIFQEIFEKIDGREAKLTGKLSDSYILGYYHQKESFYQKQEEDAEKPEAIAI